MNHPANPVPFRPEPPPSWPMLLLLAAIAIMILASLFG